VPPLKIARRDRRPRRFCSADQAPFKVARGDA